MKRKKVIMIGPFPPPIGGVSNHLSRLVFCLKNEYTVIPVDTSRNKLRACFILFKETIKSVFRKEKVIAHVHVFNLKICILLSIFCGLFKVCLVQTIHSFRISEEEIQKKSLFFKFLLKKFAKIIVVNKDIEKRLIKIEPSIQRKTLVLPAFIPYPKNYEKNRSIEYINNIGAKSFLEEHDIIIVGNAYKIVFYNDEDLYGLDLCVEAIKQLRHISNFSVGFIFFLPQIGEIEYYKKINADIVLSGIQEDFLFVTKNVPLVPMFDFADIFVRPTNSDGDALSLREALYAGIPSIASDVVERPQGTILFKNRDSSDYIAKLLQTINNIDEEKRKTMSYSKAYDDFSSKYSKIYANI